MEKKKIKSFLSIVLCIMLVLSNVAYADNAKVKPDKPAAPVVPTAPTVTNVEQSAVTTKTITNISQLMEAIKTQADGQTWIIKKGIYEIVPDEATLRDNDGKIVSSGGQSGWYMPITANNLTIIGTDKPVITSRIEKANGAWASQNLITVWGDNVTIKGLTIQPKVETNKTIEVVGNKKFTVENCTFTPNTVAAGAIEKKGGSLYFNGAGTTGTKAILVKNNTFNFACVAFDGVLGSNIMITGNTFEHIADGAYAIGNTYWGSAERKTIQYANINIKGNNFKNVTDSTKIIAARLNQTFIVDKANKINGKIIKKTDFAKYVNFDNASYWPECKDNKVIVDGVNYANKYQNVGTYVTNATQLLASINGAKDNDTIVVAAGTYELPSQLTITKPMTIKGNGAVVIKAASAWAATENFNKHLISINGVRGLVKLENLTISNAKRAGINVWESTNVILKDITSKDNAGAGLVVVNSAVAADHLNTSGNAWGYGVNVDNGSNPSAGAPATSFTLNSGTIAEAKQIVSDKGGVTIVAPNYKVFINDANKVYGANITSWYGTNNELLDTSVNFNFNNIRITDIDFVKFSLYQEKVLLGTAYSTGGNLVRLWKECAPYWEKTADTYTQVTGVRTTSCAFSNSAVESNNGYWVRSACTATNAAVPNGLVVEVVVDNVTYTAVYSR